MTGEALAMQELGRHIISDPTILDGAAVFRGTRIRVSLILDDVANGLPWNEIISSWNNNVGSAHLNDKSNEEAIAEALDLTRRGLLPPHPATMIHFWRPNARTVVSVDGFAIRHESRDTMEYREGDRRMAIEVEGGFDRHGQCVCAVYLNATGRWEPRSISEPVTPQEKARIAENIAKAMLFEGIFPEFR